MPSPFLAVASAALLAMTAAPETPALQDATPVSSASEAPAAETGAAEAATSAQRPGGRSWFAFPVVFWLPETKLGVAVAAGVHFHVAKGAGDSNAFFVAGYTLLNQGTIDLSSDVMLKNDTLLTGRLRFAYYPDTYYGIGPSTTLAQREELTRRFAEAMVTAEFPIVSRLRLGGRLHGRVEEIVHATPGGEIATGAVPGADGFDALGFGVQATWDSRDDPLWTTRGAFLQAWYASYPAAIGRNAGFFRGAAEARWFRPLGRGRVLGLAAQLEHADRDTPFSILPKIGNTRFLRGIRDGRYRDAIAWAAQSELRFPFADKFAAAVFGAFGDVTPKLPAQRADTIKVAGGAGLRYRLTRQGADLRVDAAVSPQGEGVEFYVLLLEAF